MAVLTEVGGQEGIRSIRISENVSRISKTFRIYDGSRKTTGIAATGRGMIGVVINCCSATNVWVQADNQRATMSGDEIEFRNHRIACDVEKRLGSNTRSIK